MKRRRALLALAPFAALLAVEVLLRAALGPPLRAAWSVVDRHYADEGRPLFRPDGDGFVRADPRAPARPRLSVRKEPGTYRLFVLGGSVGLPFNEGAARFEDSLAPVVRGRLEAIHAASPASDAERDAAFAREALALDADALLVLTGNNEFYDPPSPSAAAQRLRWLLRQSHLLRPLLETPSADRLGPEERAARFERAVRAILAAAEKRKAAVLLATLPYDADGFAPRKPPRRSDPARNAALRSMCRPPACAIVDLERLMPRLGPAGAVFHDECHWRLRYYPAASREVASALARLTSGRAPRERAASAPQAADREEALSLLAAAALGATDRAPGEARHEAEVLRRALSFAGEAGLEPTCAGLSAGKETVIAALAADPRASAYARRLRRLWRRVEAACGSLDDRRGAVAAAG